MKDSEQQEIGIIAVVVGDKISAEIVDGLVQIYADVIPVPSILAVVEAIR